MQQPRLLQHVRSVSAVAKLPSVRSSSSVATSRGWEHDGLPVAPLLGGSEKLPANLKLAVEAWPGEEEEEEDDSGEVLRVGPILSGHSQDVTLVLWCSTKSSIRK